MTETTISVLDSKTLLSIFGPRDQYLRKIRSALGVDISARDEQHPCRRGRILGSQGHRSARAAEGAGRAARIGRGGRRGPGAWRASPATAFALAEQRPIEVLQAGRTVRPRTAGQARICAGDHGLRPGVLHRSGRHGQNLSGRGDGRRGAEAGADSQDRAGAAGGRGGRKPGFLARRFAGQDQSRICGRCSTPCAR